VSFFDERWVTLFIFITIIGVLMSAPALSALGLLSMVQHLVQPAEPRSPAGGVGAGG
jgi:hypothetical protein